MLLGTWLTGTGLTGLSSASAQTAAPVQAALVQAPTGQAATVDYAQQIKPLLAAHCGQCHSAIRQRGGLRLDTAALIQQGGDSGPALVPGKPQESLLWQVVSGKAGFSMPPDGQGLPLKPAQVQLLESWIASGAPGPKETEIPAADPHRHWAFVPPVRPPVPLLATSDTLGHPVDAFLASAQRSRGLVPLGPADRATLLRRVFLDLIGMPPTRAELHAFLADDAPDAYERVVEQLLARPQYGERWGRHWMDVWRYSDWSGYGNEIRNSQKHIWHWRDWIVESLNADLGYDRMLQDMLAADELAPGDPQRLRATGYLARNWYKFNRNTWMQNTLEHTGKAFLGLTIGCARCHDHMYDPVSQQDYYAFRAFFEPHQVRTDRLPGELSLEKGGLPRVFDAEPSAVTVFFERGDERRPVKDKTFTPRWPEFFGETPAIEPVPLPHFAIHPDLRPSVLDDLRKAAHDEIEKASAALRPLEQKAHAAQQAVDALVSDEHDAPAAEPNRLRALREELATAKHEHEVAALAFTLAQDQEVALDARIAADQAQFAKPPDPRAKELSHAANRAERASAQRLAERALLQARWTETLAQRTVASEPAAGEPANAKHQQALTAAQKQVAEATKKFHDAKKALAQNPTAHTPLGPSYPATSTGRRLALAQWITRPDHPLTARVCVNHVWLRHFGQPLVSTVFDFGLHGQPPSHPELLDWLAVELVEHRWSLKHLHRVLVTSAAYQRQSSSGPQKSPNESRDQDNHYVWRMNAKRMEAEAVRDSLLAAAGTLDATFGGPELEQNSGLNTFRRSLYYRHAYERQMQFLQLFDVASVEECYRRSTSVVPQQALALANSPLTLAQSRGLAKRLATSASGPQSEDDFVIAAFETILSRGPSPQEASLCREFLRDQAARLSSPGALTAFTTGPAPGVAPSTDPAQRARENLLLVLFNHVDFVTIR